ncbi:mechanosensitive ion channel family protein [uncultured Methanomethylovorans sp.]|uniref:mechanosensitive ion channel family protein n=1 Tax=uncultured Methanomethylovorans sp. TaxID=183759 RepID=UPI002AA67904|nr:mechanosensitive ion channel family protein [uncultured Methanomethylovorans sp.]
MSILGNASFSSLSAMSLSSLAESLSLHFVKVAFVILIIFFTVLIARIVDKLMVTQVRIMNKKMNIDQTSYSIIRHSSVAVIYLMGLVVTVSSIPFLEKISVALLAGAGFAGIVVGLAAQNTLGNIISGVSLAFFRPFRVGDRVNVMNEYGKVTDITLRHTIVRTWDNRRLIIPNSVIGSEAIINWSIEDPTVRWLVDVGISYDSDIDLARKIMLEEAKKHVNIMTYLELKIYDPTIPREETIQVMVTELGDYAVTMRLYFWCLDRKYCFSTGCDLRESIKKRFDAEGVEIPFPYRTIVYKDKLASNARLANDQVDDQSPVLSPDVM